MNQDLTHTLKSLQIIFFLLLLLVGISYFPLRLHINAVAFNTPLISALPSTATESSQLSPDTCPPGSKVGLQVGHWLTHEAPAQLASIRRNTGAQVGDDTELAVNLEITHAAATLLRDQGCIVDILPTTIPEGYLADAFISVHADGHPDPNKTGYKSSGPYRDSSGRSRELSRFLDHHYQLNTGMAHDPEITVNMTDYYAFAWWRQPHSVHPQTPAVLLETGFLTNSSDRDLIVNHPDIPAQAIASAIVEFLNQPTN